MFIRGTNSSLFPRVIVISYLGGENLGELTDPGCGCVEEDCTSQCTGISKFLSNLNVTFVCSSN